MKKVIPIMIAILSGLFILLALFFKPYGVLDPSLKIVLNWAVITASMTLLVAISNLFLIHMRYIIDGRKGFLYSLIFISIFLISFLAGMFLGVDDPLYLMWISAIQRPLEVALLGLVAVVMASAALKIFRVRGWSVLSVSFGISAVVFLIINLGILQALDTPWLNDLLQVLQNLPLVGARGLLLGISLGLLIIGLRVLLGIERPYSV